ncbi:GldL-related protein [Flavitalea flava]
MQFEKILNTVYSFGAAVVIFGAWGKLEHKDFGSAALTVGLLTEVAIFCVYGLMEWRKKSLPEGLETSETMFRPKEDLAVKTAANLMGPVAGMVTGVEMKELTNTMKQTNQILSKVFRTEGAGK